MKKIATLAAIAAVGAAAMAGFGEASQRAAQSMNELRHSLQGAKAGDQQRGPGTSAYERALRAFMRSGGNHPDAGGYRSREGWTDRRYRRAALKQRNRAKHRAACKGRRS